MEDHNTSDWSLFICHASEDKETLVRPLARKLIDVGFEVWYDEATLTWGASLRRSIDAGLAQCRYGLVVLSKAFFAKEWPQRELDGLTTRETSSGETLVLPVWHNVTQKEVAEFSPPLADRLAISSEQGIDHIVLQVKYRVGSPALPLLSVDDTQWQMERFWSDWTKSPFYDRFDPAVEPPVFSTRQPEADCQIEADFAPYDRFRDNPNAVVVNHGPEPALLLRYGSYLGLRSRHLQLQQLREFQTIQMLQPDESYVIYNGFAQDDFVHSFVTWSDSSGRQKRSWSSR